MELENTLKLACFCVYVIKIYMKAQKHACFHIFSPFSAHLYPPLHHNGKRSISCTVLYVVSLCMIAN